jgi:DNA-binding NtrC family response regulator
MHGRLVIALEEAAKEREIEVQLTSPGWVIERIKGKRKLWEQLHSGLWDLALVSRRRIPEPVEESIMRLASNPDSPDIVVVLHRASAEERARLLAAGCHAVLDASVELETMADVVRTVLARHHKIDQQRFSATRELLSQPSLDDFVSRSPTMVAFMGVVRRVVDNDVPLLILGETGVGKERLARAIHAASPRAKGAFVAINCAALPETLLESELFGHVEGAFTGAARSRRGCFELAEGGTVFLDEIGEIPIHLQVKLLRVLQDHEVRRLGGEAVTQVDVRVMAATNRDLEREVEAGRFRSDLYYRLCVLALTLPPLRTRRDDIPELATGYVEYLRPRLGVSVFHISADALQALQRYSWPGNVRELINVIERGMLLCRGDTIGLAELPESIRTYSDVAPSPPIQPADVDPFPMLDRWSSRAWKDVRTEIVAQAERAYLAGLLRLTGGRVGETARRAGINPRSIFQKMRHHGLRKEDFRV